MFYHLTSATLERGFELLVQIIFAVQSVYMTDLQKGFRGMTCLLMYVSFHLCNHLVRRDARKGINEANSVTLLCVLDIVIITLVFMAYFLEEPNLFWSCVFIPPGPINSFPSLIWLLGVNDFCIKMFTILGKIVVSFLPDIFYESAGRGRYYQALERWSQFYRHLATLLPWSVYLYTTASLNNYCYFMMYISIKTSMARASVNNIWLIVKRILFNNGMYGDKPSDTDIQQYDGTCPICKASFHDPCKLVCQHVFCNQCVARWLEVEATCPMCRTQVPGENIPWVNAGTSVYIQLI